MNRSRTGYSQIVTRVTISVVVLVTVLLCGLLVTLWAVAGYQTTVAQMEQSKLAQGAVDVRGEHIEKSALDYGAWDEAVEKLVVSLDREWADENIGRPTFQNLGFDMAVVMTSYGAERYAMVRGERTDRPVAGRLTGGFDVLLDRQRLAGPKGSTYGLILADGRPSIAAVVPIRRLEVDPADRAPPHLLVLVDAIDADMLGEFAHTYLLPKLRISDGGTTSGAFAPLVSADGHQVARFEWEGARPGDALLRTAIPVWIAVALAFALLTGLFLRQARSAARAVAESEHRATHDGLTGLPNRVLLFERLDAASLSLAAGGRGFVVAYLDLDGFKAVNDRLGHEVGDAVIRQVSARIGDSLRGPDFVARLGGDEFVVISYACVHRPAALAFCRRIIAAIERPILLDGGGTTGVSATIGLTFAPEDGTDPLVLLRKADQALYLGKRGGRRQARFHTAAIDDRLTA